MKNSPLKDRLQLQIHILKLDADPNHRTTSNVERVLLLNDVIFRASDRLRQKKGNFAAFSRGIMGQKKVHYAANYAIFITLFY